jgi:nitroreductase
MKKLLSKYFPKTIIKFHIIAGFYYDAKRILKHSASIRSLSNKNKLNSLIIRQSHGLEKALSLPSPEKNRGEATVRALLKNSNWYYKKFGYDYTLRIAIDNLIGYKKINNSSSMTNIKKLIEDIDSFIEKIKEYDFDKEILIGGSKLFTKQEWEKNASEFDFKNFVSARVSIRNFSNEEIDDKDIQESIKIALRSPSHCNRQPWKVRIYKGDNKNHILQYQNGNKGFTDSIKVVLLITGTISSFNHKERSAVWIDGGLFSMSLIYALLNKKIGSCPLNTQYTIFQENSLRKAAKLADDEVPVMMLGLGYVKDTFSIANSSRKLLNDVIVTNEQ